MRKQVKSFQLSSSPDPHHHHRVFLFGIAALFLLIIGGGLGFIWAINNIAILQSQIGQQLAETSTKFFQWKTYTNTQAGFIIQYPSDWFVNDLSQSKGLNKNTSTITDVYIGPQPTNSGYGDNIHDVHILAVNNSSFQAYAEGQSIQIDNTPATKRTVAMSQLNATADIITIHKTNYAYTIALESNKNDVAKYQSTFYQILSTFKFIK